MKFSLIGVNKLHSPVVVAGRTYIIKGPGALKAHSTITFLSPKGAKVELEFQADKTWGSNIWPWIDGVRIPHPTSLAFMGDTDGMPEPLKRLVDQAIFDLESEEVRLDPTGRHAKSRKAGAANQAEASKVAAALKHV
jgi:hypothetical protein